MTKIKINRNILWARSFVNELAVLGVKYVSISPGSRNTPLTIAFANNKAIKSFIHIDERCSGFFALGLAKASNSPVAVVCTSGTATVELYPSIVEAYQQRVPLIICTADRPPELLNMGANQTINQNNIYRNHIRWFYNAGLPDPDMKSIRNIKLAANNAVFYSTIKSRGPVHLNFPFKKPFEPDSFTDEIDQKLLIFAGDTLSISKKQSTGCDADISKQKWFLNIFNYFKKCEKGLIIVGPDNYNPEFLTNCQILSKKLSYPVLADGTSQLRFGNHSKENIITNFDAFLRSDKFSKSHQPDIIIQFGRTVTSKGLDTFLSNCTAARFMINEFGDWFDPADKALAVYACKPYLFCKGMIKLIDSRKPARENNSWLMDFKSEEKISSKLKARIINNSDFPNESRIINEILLAIPNECQIMISNSMPVRDFDYFASLNEKEIIIYNNRGASGIDGITSTALGIVAANPKPTVLITGDLAFYYDLNGLLSAKNYNLPLVIVLINNNGGGIFEILPISNYREIFNEYFRAAHNLEFKTFVKAFGGNYKLIKGWKDLNSSLYSTFKAKNFSVLEIKTNATSSLKSRRKYWKAVANKS
ncbi:MAG: 2-succinyl-5-enolpyruvyl-6-hydroxy-3-cyclohexene-1-carboxylic-acid synthase [Ignavibacteriaceae bacterium]